MKAVTIIMFTALATLGGALPTKDAHVHPYILGYKREPESGGKAPYVLGYKRDAEAEAAAVNANTVGPDNANLPDGTVIPTYGCPDKG